MPFDLAMLEEALGDVAVVVAQDEGDDRQLMKCPPAGLSSGGMPGAEQALHLGGHQTGPRMLQGQCREFGIGPICLLAVTPREVLAGF